MNENIDTTNNEITEPIENSEPRKDKNGKSLNGLNNLVPFNELSEEKQRELRSRGGKKSGEVRRKRKEAREYLEKILATDIPKQSVEEILGEAKILCNEDYSAYNVLMVKLLQLGLGGSEKAIMLLRDTVGDKPIDKSEVSANIMTEEDKKQLDKMRKELMSIIS